MFIDLDVLFSKLDDILTIFFPANQSNSGFNNYSVMTLAANSTGEITFAVPNAAGSVEKVYLCGIVEPGAASTNRDIDLFSNYSANTEVYNAHTASDTTTVYDLSASANKIHVFDITTLFQDLSAGDFAGLTIDHNRIGGDINYLGLILEYKLVA